MKNGSLHLLIVDDEEAHVEAIRRAFSMGGIGVTIETARTLEEYRACIAARTPDLALIDLNLPDGRAIEVLTAPAADAPFPILVMTAFGTQSIVVEVMKAGALDYVVKSPAAFTTLPHTVERACREWKLLQGHKRAEEALRALATGFSFETGREFFESVSAHLARSLDADYAFIGELMKGGERVRALGGYGNGGPIEPLEYDLVDSPCANVIGQSICVYTEGVQALFPHDRLLAQMGVEGYAATPLFSKAREPLGNLVVLSSKRIENPEFVKTMLGVFSDRVSAEIHRKQGEEALRNSEQRYRLLFNSGYDSVFVHESFSADGLPGRFLEVNDIACQRLGYSREELLQMTPADLDAPETKVAAPGIAKKLLEGKHAVWEGVQLTKDGRRIAVEISNHLIDLNGKPAHLAMVRDITLRKASEQQIRKLSQAVEQSPSAIIITNTKGEIEYVNPKFTEITGYSLEEVLGNNPRFLKSGDVPPETYKLLWSTITAGREWHGELHNRKKNGELFWESSSISAITNENGEITHFLAVSEDITAHKILTEQLLRAQRLENIGRLSSGVAHDLNNILTPIMMASSMLDGDIPQEAHHQFVSIIQESAKRGADIVNQVLTFARGVEGEKTTLNPQLLVAQVENILRETFPKSISMDITIPEGLWTVTGDVTQLHQVLINLCVNARDAMMPAGGTLKLTARNEVVGENNPAVSRGAKPGHYIMMEIVDSGCGIPATILDKIFDPFFTTKEVGKGTGLGLSSVTGILKSHGGFLEVESHEGSGTSFRVFIPASENPQLEPDQATIPATPRGKGETVLIVDDEPRILKLATVVLTQNNYMVLSANDGLEALTAYVKNAGFIKVVITDVMMPNMDGVILSRALRRINPNVRIIAASGHTEEGHQNELKALGINLFLTKPFHNCQLLEAVHNTIHG